MRRSCQRSRLRPTHPSARWISAWKRSSGPTTSASANIDDALRNPPEYVSTAKVFDILMAVPKFGRVKAARFLNQCRISQSKTVGGLSERQRAELIGLFNR